MQLDEAKVDLVRCCTVVGAATLDVDELTVIVFAPVGAVERVWAVSAVLGDLRPPLAWGCLKRRRRLRCDPSAGRPSRRLGKLYRALILAQDSGSTAVETSPRTFICIPFGFDFS